MQLHGVNYFGNGPDHTPAPVCVAGLRSASPSCQLTLSCSHAGFNVSGTVQLQRIMPCLRMPCRMCRPLCDLHFAVLPQRLVRMVITAHNI